ncbi:MAG: hypothetical protein IPO41_17050 [Acidobacteria bacterium]|nr:hypothetical protein [Acidobacteriota bacterium]MBK9529970.1 hypothetical protein [Acidobacteriota bacterium]MBP7474298.1 hypothetical protein [Pyrinomonadaceae bacterium]MBP9109148.1 hypothetical protein [Pyrinomonadaceae bacterium]
MKVLRAIVFLTIIATSLSCAPSRPTLEMPGKFLWAWERPEDLRFIDSDQFGVAFLAQTINIESDRVSPQQRRQTLDVPPGTYLIAVTRIETSKETTRRPKLDVSAISKITFLVKKTLELPDVKAVQIDFDAVVSERQFYRSLMTEIRKQLPPQTPLTMTALASWCTGDAWFSDFPVGEAVPMVFQMGADSEKIKTYLANGNDWTEPLCRTAYGISLTEGKFTGMKPDRRIYYFKDESWKKSDLDRLN